MKGSILAFLVAPMIVAADPKPPQDELPQPPSTGRELPGKVTLPPMVQAEIARKIIKTGTCKDKVAVMATAVAAGGHELTSEERLATNTLLFPPRGVGVDRREAAGQGLHPAAVLTVL